jgi:hypothetical protein
MHIAFGHLTITTWVHRLSAGLPVTETMADFAVVNAADEQKYAKRQPDRGGGERADLRRCRAAVRAWPHRQGVRGRPGSNRPVPI